MRECQPQRNIIIEIVIKENVQTPPFSVMSQWDWNVCKLEVENRKFLYYQTQTINGMLCHRVCRLISLVHSNQIGF